MKNTFAELLSEIISHSEISKNEMIRACDIDRSSFFKFLNGARIPTAEQFTRICDKLQFYPEEEKKLRLEYAKITQGEQKVLSENWILELLWKLENSIMIDNAGERFADGRTEEQSRGLNETVIFGKRKVLELLENTILNAVLSNEKTAEIDMFIPEKTDEFLDWMVSFLRSDLSNRIKVRHLIELPSRNSSIEQVLMDRLKFALISTSGNSRAYSGYYYYAYNSISSYAGVLYAYSLITEHRAVLLNERLDKAIVIADPDFCRDCRDRFMIALNSAKPIIKMVKEQDIVKELDKPVMYLYGGQNFSVFPTHEDTVFYISSGSVQRFAEIGSISGKSDSKVFEADDRIEILKRAKEELGSKMFLIDERSIPPAGSWSIALSGKDKLIMHRKGTDNYFVVTESSIVDAFYTFLEDLPNTGNLLKTELAREIFDDIIESI